DLALTNFSISIAAGATLEVRTGLTLSAGPAFTNNGEILLSGSTYRQFSQNGKNPGAVRVSATAAQELIAWTGGAGASLTVDNGSVAEFRGNVSFSNTTLTNNGLIRFGGTDDFEVTI